MKMWNLAMWMFCFIVFVSVNNAEPAIFARNITSSPGPCTDENHIFLVPGVLAAGGVNRACVSRFHPTGQAKIHLILTDESRKTVTATRDLPPGDGGCIDITAPQLPNTKADLVVNIRYPEAQCTWERRISLRIGSGRVVVAHTERARYRPGETVRARVFLLKPDLAPAHGQISQVWLEGPPGAWEGTRVAEWTNVHSRLGIAQVEYNLDELAPPGRWTVRAKLADGSQGSSSFLVGNYELPPFQLSVKHAPRVLRTSERLVWTVCVRYPWTEAVEGMLVIRIRGAGASSDGNTGIRTAVRLKAPRACHRHAAAGRRIGLHGPDAPDVVLADFSFQEEGTRIWQNTTVVSQVVDKAVELEFLSKHRIVISPGLPYKLKVKASRWDEKPVSSAKVRVCRSPSSGHAPPGDAPAESSAECKDAVTDEAGVARVMFTADADNIPVYKFEATLKNDSTISAAPLFLPVQRQGTVFAALGPVKADPYAARAFVPLYLSTRKITHAITVHFVVITRGGIIYRWGATTQCPITNSDSPIDTASRNSTCRIYDRYVITPVSADELLDRQLLRVMLPIKVTHQMCPDSHILAYFYLNGELISASKHLEMDECFPNKVEATWASRLTPPGSSISLQLSTPGPAFCALTALDSAAKWIRPGESVKDLMLTTLKRLIEGHRNLTEYDTAAECFLTSDSGDLPTSTPELTAAWLATAGVRALGSHIAIRSCPATSPMPLTAYSDMVPRSDFSEAWLWRLVAVGWNNSATITATAPDAITRYEASAVCLSRTGVAVSPPAVLQVFREFFIHADSPRRLRRDDHTILRYRVFNYLYEPLSVQIQILSDPHLEVSKQVETACIGARASIARRVEVRARLTGRGRISVRAMSFAGACSNVTADKSGISDEVMIQIYVDPEGVPNQDMKSMLVCGRGVDPGRSNEELVWSWDPVHAVPGTEELTMWVAGDVTGPLQASADDLILLPRGCGEQNMARMATNLLALKLLDPHSAAAATARAHVARGFTRQLQYLHPGGGFSGFGASDATPSTWLTAFAVRYLRKAHKVLTPDLPAPPALERAERWLLDQQMENGCFRNEGQVFHRELRGGLDEDGEIASVGLTAYVITSLLDSSVLPSRVIRNALSCLRAIPQPKTKTPTRIYAQSLLAYTFMMLREYERIVTRSNEAEASVDKRDIKAAGLKTNEEMKELIQLVSMAKRSEEFVWWETGNLATSIEATGYALLALSVCARELRDASCAHDARGAVRWLSTHRNAAGGFVATQDTLVALEALSTWQLMSPPTAGALNITARSGDVVKSLVLTPEMRVPAAWKMGAGDQLSVHVEGSGCALVQATRSYHTLAPAIGNKRLTVEVAVHPDGPFNCDHNQTKCDCAAVVEACVSWVGSFPHMALLEVSLPGGFGADAARLYSQLLPTSALLRRIELTPSSARATLYLGLRDGSATLGRSGHHCYKLHAVGPQTRTKPGYARLQDYYNPAVNDTRMFTIPEECEPTIIHTKNQYLPSDNLFNKAKSLANSDEIVITNEFSFEDIPEGIPLDDPLYENLTREPKGNTVWGESQNLIEAVKGDRNLSKLIRPEHENNMNKVLGNRSDRERQFLRTADEGYATKPELTSTVNAKNDEVRTETHEDNESNKNIFHKQETGNKIESSTTFNANPQTVFKPLDKPKTSQSVEETVNVDKAADANVSKLDKTKKGIAETTINTILQSVRTAKNKIAVETVNSDTTETTVIDSDNTTLGENLNKDTIPGYSGNEDSSNKSTYLENAFEGFVDTTSKLAEDTELKAPETELDSTKQLQSNQEKELAGQTTHQQTDVNNPNLSDFHVIDSATDLEVPSGVEGPVPVVMAPPPGYEYRPEQRGPHAPTGFYGKL